MHEVSDDEKNKEQTITCQYCNEKYICKIINDRVKIEKHIFEKWEEYEKRSRNAS